MDKTIISQLQAAGKYIFDSQLTWGTSGNLSCRLAVDHLIITASGTCLGKLGDADFLECDLHGNVIEGSGKPSVELPFHREIYLARPDVNVILHTSPFYATLIACSEITIPNNLFIECMYYLEHVEWVPYAHPGSQELASMIRNQITHSNVLMLRNHGVVVVDDSLGEALAALNILNIVCKMLVETRRSEITLKGISPEQVQSFLEKEIYRPRRRFESGND